MDRNMMKQAFRRNSGVRDLGGIQTADGRRVKSGVLYRSCALSRLNEDELEAVRSLGLKTVFDLRSRYEIMNEPDPVIEGAVFRMIGEPDEESGNDAELSSAFLRSEIEWLTRGKQEYRSGMKLTYLNMLCGCHAFGILLEVIQTDCAPVLFHCAAGRDRSGLAAVLILLALGVSMKDAADEYLMKDRSECPDHPGTEEVNEEDLPYAEMTADIIDSAGGAQAYLEKAYGLNDEKRRVLRNMYLEQAV